jgi:hypothetical protein
MDEMTNNTGVETTETEQTETKTYTQEEVLKLIQSETDKRVTAALKTQQKKYEKQLTLSKLDDDERAKAEKDDRIAELEAMLAERDIEKNKSELKSVLASRGLSAEFADIIIINDDIQASQANIDKLDKLFKAAIKAEVERRLAGSAPRTSTSTSGEITKEQFRAMPLSQQAMIAKDQPELYKRLTN